MYFRGLVAPYWAPVETEALDSTLGEAYAQDQADLSPDRSAHCCSIMPRGVTALYDRHSYDAEKREALSQWADRLDQILNDGREVST